MTFDYDVMQDLSVDLITEFGQDITLTRVTTGTFNPATGAVTGDSETDSTIKALITDFSDFHIEGSAIQRGDKKVLIAGDITAPTVKDKLTISGTEYMIINVNTISPAGTDVLYKLQVRR